MKNTILFVILLIFSLPIYFSVTLIMDELASYETDGQEMFYASLVKNHRTSIVGNSSSTDGSQSLFNLPNLYSNGNTYVSRSRYPHKSPNYRQSSAYETNQSNYSMPVLSLSQNDRTVNGGGNFYSGASSVSKGNPSNQSKSSYEQSSIPSVHFPTYRMEQDGRKSSWLRSDNQPFVPLADMEATGGPQRDDQDPGLDPVGNPIPVDFGMGILFSFAFLYLSLKIYQVKRLQSEAL